MIEFKEARQLMNKMITSGVLEIQVCGLPAVDISNSDSFADLALPCTQCPRQHATVCSVEPDVCWYEPSC